MPVSESDIDKELYDLYIRGKTHHASRTYDDALNCYNEALKLNSPRKIGLYLAKANTLIALGKIDEAISCWQEILKVDPENFDALYLLGKTFQNQGNLIDAIRSYEAALKVKPNDEKTLTKLGAAFDLLGRSIEAIFYFDEALSYNSHYVPAHYNRGVASQALKNYEDAVLCYRKVIEIDPRNDSGLHINAYHNMGTALLALKQYEEAIVYFNKTLELDSQHALTYVNKAVTLNHLMQYTDAIKCFEEALKLVRAGIYGKDVSSDNRAFITDKLNTHCTDLLLKTESIIKLEETGAITSPTNKKQTDTLVNEAAILFENSISGKDTKADIQALIERMNEFEKTFVRREEVSYAIKHNTALIAMEAEQELIVADSKLNDYYRSFQVAFNRVLLATMAQASDRISKKPTVLNIPIDDFAHLIPVPFVSDIVKALCTITNIALSIYETNKVKRLASLAPSITEMDRVIEKVARKITLAKQDEILTVTDKSSWLAKLMGKVKDKVIIREYDNPQKQLALANASKLLLNCMLGKVDADMDIIPQFIALVTTDEVGRHYGEIAVSAVSAINTAASLASLATSAASAILPSAAAVATPAPATAPSDIVGRSVDTNTSVTMPDAAAATAPIGASNAIISASAVSIAGTVVVSKPSEIKLPVNSTAASATPFADTERLASTAANGCQCPIT